MSSLLILVAAAALGIEAGWEPLPDGGHEYIIQIEPQLLDVLKRQDEAIISSVPPNLQIRRCRIMAGTGKLPRVDGPFSAAVPGAAPHATEPPTSDPFAHQQVPPIQVPTTAVPHDNPPAEPSHEPAGGPGFGQDHSTAAKGAEDPGPAFPMELPRPPKELPQQAAAAKTLGHKQVDFKDNAVAAHGEKINTEKPKLDGIPEADQPRPWLPFLIVLGLLCCSLGGNVFLGVVARDARVRYREIVSRTRTAPAA